MEKLMNEMKNRLFNEIKTILNINNLDKMVIKNVL